jgi:hypothetical protein
MAPANLAVAFLLHAAEELTDCTVVARQELHHILAEQAPDRGVVQLSWVLERLSAWLMTRSTQ